MAQLHITELKCIRQQDISGKDEPVIFVGGIRVWNGKIDRGQTIDAGLDVRRSFTGSVLVELKENNGGDLDTKNKLLGSWTIPDSPRSTDKLTATSSGYHYELFYHVD